MMKTAFLCLCLLPILVPAVRAVAPPDQQARFLAGLPVTDPELEPLARETAWQEHAQAFQRAWVDLEQRQLGPIRNWLPAHHRYLQQDRSPLFYLFSGPDFLYAHAFFPSAASYILCGREPVGELPDVAPLSSTQRAASLAGLRTSLNAILSYSFFITADMKNDLAQPQLGGTLPVLYVFLARAGCRIVGAERVKLNDAGELTPAAGKTPGVRIRFIGTGGREQSLFYFSSDLSDWGVRSQPGFLRFCEKQGTGNGFVKAASYLMHQDGFGRARDFLLTRTRHLVQDDSGIPFRFFQPEQWDLSLHGHYPGPIELFKQHFQPDLDAAFRSSGAAPLPFGVGYQWRPSVSSLLIGTAFRGAPRALPAGD